MSRVTMPNNWRTMMNNQQSIEVTVDDFVPLAGFRFNPEPHELINCYLIPKIFNEAMVPGVNIPHIEIYNNGLEFHPDNLTGREKPIVSEPYEKEWFVYTLLQNKHGDNNNNPDEKSSGTTYSNRVAGGGTWKANGKRAIINKAGEVIGFMESLTFKSSRGGKKCGNWLMKEYRINEHHPMIIEKMKGRSAADNMMALRTVLCQIHKKPGAKGSSDNDHGAICSSPPVGNVNNHKDVGLIISSTSNHIIASEEEVLNQNNEQLLDEDDSDMNYEKELEMFANIPSTDSDYVPQMDDIFDELEMAEANKHYQVGTFGEQWLDGVDLFPDLSFEDLFVAVDYAYYESLGKRTRNYNEDDLNPALGKFIRLD